MGVWGTQALVFLLWIPSMGVGSVCVHRYKHASCIADSQLEMNYTPEHLQVHLDQFDILIEATHLKIAFQLRYFYDLREIRTTRASESGLLFYMVHWRDNRTPGRIITNVQKLTGANMMPYLTNCYTFKNYP